MRALCLTLALFTCALAAPPHSPKPPAPPRAELLGFEEARAYLARARVVAAALRPGALVVWDTPAGPRLTAPLLLGDVAVARVFVTADGALVPRGEERALPDAPTAPGPPPLKLAAQIARLTVSSFARVRGPQVRCYLLSAARVVAELRFDRASGQLLADRKPPSKPKKPKGSA